MMITYFELFWLFMLGNVLGMIIEGFWCLFRYGKWETHVVALWGPFNIVYGIGIVAFYAGSALLCGQPWPLRLLAYAAAGSLVEYICGIVIRIGIRMKAWDYSDHFLNIQGLISPKMMLVWAILGMGVDRFLYMPLKTLLSHIHTAPWQMACWLLTAFMIVNYFCTAACIIRWSNRHKGKAPLNRISRWIDAVYPDSRMKKKFCNWSFIDDNRSPESLYKAEIGR